MRKDRRAGRFLTNQQLALFIHALGIEAAADDRIDCIASKKLRQDRKKYLNILSADYQYFTIKITVDTF
jgi:hypothetical protein